MNLQIETVCDRCGLPVDAMQVRHPDGHGRIAVGMCQACLAGERAHIQRVFKARRIDISQASLDITVGDITGEAQPYAALPGDVIALHAQIELDLGPGFRLILEDCNPDDNATRAKTVMRRIRELLIAEQA